MTDPGFNPTMDKATIIRRIAAESMPGTEKETIAVKLGAFVLGCSAKCLQLLVDNEREAAEGALMDDDDSDRYYYETADYDPEPEDMTNEDWDYWLEVVGK